LIIIIYKNETKSDLQSQNQFRENTKKRDELLKSKKKKKRKENL